MIEKAIGERFGPEAVIRREDGGIRPVLVVRTEFLADICRFLRDTEGFYFDFLSNITAVDHHPEHRFSVVYHLASIPYGRQVTLKAELENDRRPDGLPEVPSVSAVWRTADWHEREAFDLMGIYFTGHPDLRRILMPDDWEGFPLRKDYHEPESYHGIPVK